MEAFINKLSEYPNEYYLTRAFELEITGYVKDNDISDDDVKYLESLLNFKSSKSFLSLFILFTYHRRHHHLVELNRLFDDYFKLFDRNMYPILCHLEYLYRATTEKDRYQLSILVSDMKKTLSDVRFKEHIGLVHHYCELVALLGEIDENYVTKKTDEIKHTYKLIDVIISKESYPKFYLTKARLEMLLSLYDEAIRNVELSIENENTKNKDYLITINRLNDYKLRANLFKIKHENRIELEDFKQTKEQMKTDFNNATTKMEANNIKIIALFSTLIGLVIGNVTLASSPNTNPMNLMLAFTGSVFIVLGIILAVITTLGYQNASTKSQKMLSFIIIVITIIAGIIMMTLAAKGA